MVEPAVTGGPPRAPRPLLRVLGRIVVLVAIVVFFVAFNRVVPSDTGRSTLILRGVMGAAVGIVLIAVVRRSMRAFGDAPPAPPPQVDAQQVDVVYQCGVCGTRVRLEVAATGKPPRHCGEEMEPKVEPRR